MTLKINRQEMQTADWLMAICDIEKGQGKACDAEGHTGWHTDGHYLYNIETEEMVAMRFESIEEMTVAGALLVSRLTEVGCVLYNVFSLVDGELMLEQWANEVSQLSDALPYVKLKYEGGWRIMNLRTRKMVTEYVYDRMDVQMQDDKYMVYCVRGEAVDRITLYWG